MVETLVNERKTEKAAAAASDAAAYRAQAEQIYATDPRLAAPSGDAIAASARALELIYKATQIEERLGIPAQTRKRAEPIEVPRPVLDDWFARKPGVSPVRREKKEKGQSEEREGFKKMPDQLVLL